MREIHASGKYFGDASDDVVSGTTLTSRFYAGRRKDLQLLQRIPDEDIRLEIVVVKSIAENT